MKRFALLAALVALLVAFVAPAQAASITTATAVGGGCTTSSALSAYSLSVQSCISQRVDGAVRPDAWVRTSVNTKAVSSAILTITSCQVLSTTSTSCAVVRSTTTYDLTYSLRYYRGRAVGLNYPGLVYQAIKGKLYKNFVHLQVNDGWSPTVVSPWIQAG